MSTPTAAYGVRRAVLRHLAAVAPESMTGSRLRVRLHSRDRHVLDGVLAELVRDGLIVRTPARCGGRRLALATTTAGRRAGNARAAPTAQQRNWKHRSPTDHHGRRIEHERTG
ncbi:hypothetical protein MN2019_17900 [Mycolicibacterium neoaurum]|uniref:hypothetical protein n=1 Tax=Mycolicibacterium neoaurum TaxID=1795 RepID=UPI001BD1958F|nr:hypothetical protein [Mycolicibacterium neoaurum]QVI26176.1 hypothetical protein MN2019_17900 [Mycolicibacterium neoaurum]